MFSTAPLFAEAITISKPVNSSSSSVTVRVYLPLFHRWTVPENAADGSRSPASRTARSTTRSAMLWRSMVALPVPGGPLTANRSPPQESSALMELTAN
ncbi:hypothetical protein [Streptomyces sp. TE33382]